MKHPTQHKIRHGLLHRLLDELVADWIGHTEARLSRGTVLELMKWSKSQTEDPTPNPED